MSNIQFLDEEFKEEEEEVVAVNMLGLGRVLFRGSVTDSNGCSMEREPG